MLSKEERLRQHREVSKRYYQRNKEKVSKWHKEYRKENKKKISEYGYKLRAKSKTKIRLKNWREKNKEKIKEYRNRPKQRLKKRQQDKDYRERRTLKEGRFWMNEKERTKRKNWYEENKEHLKEVRKKYYKTKKGILSYQRANHIKLSIRKNRPTDLTRDKIKEIFERDKFCVYCGSNKNLELDHVIPLKWGGSCMSDNFVIACAICNRSKHSNHVVDWCISMKREVPKIVLEKLKALESNSRSLSIGA